MMTEKTNDRKRLEVLATLAADRVDPDALEAQLRAALRDDTDTEEQARTLAGLRLQALAGAIEDGTVTVDHLDRAHWAVNEWWRWLPRYTIRIDDCPLDDAVQDLCEVLVKSGDLDLRIELIAEPLAALGDLSALTQSYEQAWSAWLRDGQPRLGLPRTDAEEFGLANTAYDEVRAVLPAWVERHAGELEYGAVVLEVDEAIHAYLLYVSCSEYDAQETAETAREAFDNFHDAMQSVDWPKIVVLNHLAEALREAAESTAQWAVEQRVEREEHDAREREYWEEREAFMSKNYPGDDDD